MPAFILAIPVHLHKLLQNGRLAPNTFYSEPGRVVVMAVCALATNLNHSGILTDFRAVLVIRVIRPKQHVALRTREMLNMVLVACCQ